MTRVRRLVQGTAAVSAAAGLLLLYGGLSSSSSARCRTVYAVATVCTANAAPPPSPADVRAGKRFARRYILRFNRVMAGHGFALEWVACLPTIPGGEAVFSCVWRAHQTHGPDICRGTVVDTTWRTWTATVLGCARFPSPA